MSPEEPQRRANCATSALPLSVRAIKRGDWRGFGAANWSPVTVIRDVSRGGSMACREPHERADDSLKPQRGELTKPRPTALPGPSLPRGREKMKNLSQRRQGAKAREAEVSCSLCDSAPLREVFLLFPSFLHAFLGGEGRGERDSP